MWNIKDRCKKIEINGYFFILITYFLIIPDSLYLHLPMIADKSRKFEIGASLARSSVPNCSATGPLHLLGLIREGRNGAMLGPRAARISRPMTATVSTSLRTSHELNPRLLVSRVLFVFYLFFLIYSSYPSVARGTSLEFWTSERKWRSGRVSARANRT